MAVVGSGLVWRSNSLRYSPQSSDRCTRNPQSPKPVKNGSWRFEFQTFGAIFDITDPDLPLDGLGWVGSGLVWRSNSLRYSPQSSNRCTRNPQSPKPVKNGSWRFEFQTFGAIFDITDPDLPLDGLGWVGSDLEVQLPAIPAAEFEPVHKEPPKSKTR